MYEQLIVAEKPSVGASIAKSLFKDHKRKDGYIECEGGKIAVTWAIGHLVGLAYPEEYDEKYKGCWKLEDLPIIPDTFKLTVNKSTAKQFGVIKKLGEQSKEIVNACDSAREGELIYFYTATLAGLLKKPTKRLWTSSVTEDGLRRAYSSLKDASEYRNLRESAVVRSKADWLIGINATRAFSVQVGAGDKVNIGRVKAPVVAMIYDRCKAIEDFIKKTYYVVETEFEQGETQYKGVLDQEPFDDSKAAAEVAEKVKYESGKITSYETEEKKVYAPKLYNLTSLTSEANSKFGYTAKEVLQIAQTLYERDKSITYPRTSSNYVTKEEIPFMKKVFGVLNGSSYKPLMEKADVNFISESNKKICNEKHVEDHHAILPTENVPQNLDKKEENIYNLIVTRFIAQCFPPAEYLRHVLKTEVEGYIFHSSFKELLKIGWKSVATEQEEEDVLESKFSIDVNESVRCTEAAAVEKETEPPKPYTEGNLISAMEVAGKTLEDEELKEALKDSGIGTPATRAATIEGVKDAKYVTAKGKSLWITDKGRALVEMLRGTNLKSLTTPEYTGRWEKKLNEIARGEFSAEVFLDQAIKLTQVIVQEAGKQKVQVKHQEEPVVSCPKCKEGALVPNKMAFGCSRWKEGCQYRIWKKQFGRTLTAKQIKSLVEKGETEEMLFAPKDKEKDKYKAKLMIKDPSTGDLKLEFSNKRSDKAFGICPKCKKGTVVDRGKFLGCNSYPECSFNFSKEIKSKVLPIEQLEKLFKEGQTDLLKGFVKDGKNVTARIVKEDDKFKMAGK